MHTKSLVGVEVKDADRGQVTAIFSTFDVIDHDSDVTLAGAFEDGVEVPISAYGHTSWDGIPPVGKGVIKTTDTDARLHGQFFMNTAAGRETFEVVKQLGDLGQWSYGFDILDAEPGQKDGQRVRFLKRLKVHETSPVLVGAGVGVRTLSAKAKGDPADPPFRRSIVPHDTPVVTRVWDAPATVSAIKDAAPADLRSVYAWVDPAGDPEAKGSYRLPHHHGVGGPANVRACMTGIAALNSAAGAGVPEGDRKAAFDHLAAHLRDADREPPELRSAQSGPMKFADEGAAALAVVSSFIDRAQTVMALRAAKGKGIAPASADLLAWLEDDLKRLQSVLANPHIAADEPLADDEIGVLLAAVARANDL